MKAFYLLQTLGTVAVVLVMILVWGVPLAPTLLFYEWLTEIFSSSNKWIDALYTGLSLFAQSSSIAQPTVVFLIVAILFCIFESRKKICFPIGVVYNHPLGVLWANNLSDSTDFATFCSFICLQSLLSHLWSENWKTDTN